MTEFLPWNQKEQCRLLMSNCLKKYDEINRFKEFWDSGTELLPSDLYLNSFMNIYIEPTNQCNLDCYFCARRNMNRKPAFLSMQSYKNIIETLPAGTYVTFTGNGEPLLNVNVYDMIKMATDRGIFTAMITNGTALTEKNARNLIESGISRVQFSFDSIQRDVYEKIRRGADYFDTLLKVLRFILLARRDYIANIFITVSSVQTREVKAYADENRRFWKEIPINNYYESPLFTLQDDSGAYEDMQLDDEPWQPCVTPLVAVKINADGSVNPCPQDFSGKFTIGNVEKDNIFDILNSHEALSLRSALLKGDGEFLDAIGYHCFRCNTWRKSIGYGITEFLEATFPTITGLQMAQINAHRANSCNFLEEIIKCLQNKREIIIPKEELD